jgi:hypothetical protein
VCNTVHLQVTRIALYTIVRLCLHTAIQKPPNAESSPSQVLNGSWAVILAGLSHVPAAL